MESMSRRIPAAPAISIDAGSEVGAESILEIKSGTMRINPEQMNCDLFRFCKGDVSAFNEYQGEYMNGYSWASMTESFMTWKYRQLGE